MSRPALAKQRARRWKLSSSLGRASSSSTPEVVQRQPGGGPVAFFRTKDNLRDSTVSDAARKQRRQQFQAQQQIIEAHKAGAETEPRR
jgi:hypothetical protein